MKRRRTEGGGRSGFTLVEVLLVSAMVSIVARIAIPNVNHVLTRARAAEVLAHIQSVRTAAYEHLAEQHAWPEDAPAGAVPPDLVPYLGDGFRFEGEGYTLDWESWELPAGLPSAPDVHRLTGVTVVPDSQELADALRGLTGDRAWFSLGSAYTFLFEPQ